MRVHVRAIEGLLFDQLENASLKDLRVMSMMFTSYFSNIYSMFFFMNLYIYIYVKCDLKFIKSKDILI